MSNAGATLRIGALFALVGLLVSRFVLVGHEFLGHGGAAIAFGGEVIDHRLFVFGGGWVITRTPDLSLASQFAISLGGVALELGVAIGLAWLARNPRRSLVTRVAASIGAGLCAIHIGLYIALGTHYGYGDGLLIHRELGGARWVGVVLATLVAMAGAYWLVAKLVSLLAASFDQPTRLVLAASFVVAATFGGAVHGGLMLIERSARDDPTYAEIMRGEAERNARRTVAAEARARSAAGRPMTDQERAARTRRLADDARPLPIRFPVYMLVAAAALVSIVREREHADVPALDWRQLRGLFVLTLLALAIVLALHAPWWR